MKFVKFLVLAFVVLFSVTPVSAEEIDQYTTDISINADGTIRVTEKIDYDFGPLDRHGIFRTIPYTKVNEDGKTYEMRFDDFSVTNALSLRQTYEQTTDKQNITLKIGDADRTITGQQTYVIDYAVYGALTYFSDHDELYWNIVGNEWSVPVEEARATITLPTELDAKDVRLACFTGVAGSVQDNCSVVAAGDSVIVSASGLGVSEGLTVVVGFPKGLVSVIEPKERFDFWTTPLGIILSWILLIVGIIVVVVWYLGLPIYIVYRWWKAGRDPKVSVGVTSAWFSPPKAQDKRDLTPAETGALVDEQVDMRDISALIVDVARRGYIQIIEEKKHEFTLKRLDKTEGLLGFELRFLNEIFKKKTELKLAKANLLVEVTKLKSDLYENLVTTGLMEKNPNTIRMRYGFLGVLALFTGNILLAIVALSFGQAMPKKTVFGAEQANVGRSLRNFLKSQKKFLTFQADKQLLFEKLLPFAIAFGVEKIWADRFKNIALKQPDWYQGYSPAARFNSALFVNSLGYSFSNLSSAVTPTRSSSGFSSGFSGGGSSGGGGGGGGGGSW